MQDTVVEGLRWNLLREPRGRKRNKGRHEGLHYRVLVLPFC